MSTCSGNEYKGGGRGQGRPLRIPAYGGWQQETDVGKPVRNVHSSPRSVHTNRPNQAHISEKNSGGYLRIVPTFSILQVSPE